jgi:hypothetical protein
MDTGVVATIIPDGEVRGLPPDTLQSGTAFTTMVFYFTLIFFLIPFSQL